MAIMPAELSLSERALKLTILESFCLRKIVTNNVRLTRRIECFDLERGLIGLYRVLTYPLNPEGKQTQMWLLADLLAQIPKHWHLIRGFGEIEAEVFPGLPEFCFHLQQPENGALKNIWERVIINHARLDLWSISYWQDRIDTQFSHLKAAKENWEWACFQHYRDSFRLWIQSKGKACNNCQRKLNYMGKFVEYDNIDEAERYFLDLCLPSSPNASSHIGCLPIPPSSITTNIPSLEPFITILTYKADQNEGIDRRWLDLWRPFVEMHSGYTVLELQAGFKYERSDNTLSQEPLAIGRNLPASAFDGKDLEHVISALCQESCVLEESIQEITGQLFDVNDCLDWTIEAKEGWDTEEFSSDVQDL